MPIGRILGRLARGWTGYWFAPGGAYSSSMVRMAIAAAVLLSSRVYVVPDYELYLVLRPDANYLPKGILRLLGGTPPPAGAFEVIRLVAAGATLCALVGLFSRASMAVSLFANLCLVDLIYAGTPIGWPHGLPVVFLAQFAFALGCTGGPLSADALIRRRRGPARAPAGREYLWPILLAQWAVAMMFLNAVWYKFRAGGFGPAWALSDNLRHLLSYRHYLMLSGPSPLAEWLMAEPARYKGAAVGNFFAQVVPVLACLLVRRPFLRALCGLAFLTEVVGIALTMGLWNVHWVPLVALFIDWDWLLAAASRRAAQPVGSPAAPPPLRPRRAAALSGLILAFVGYNVHVAFWHPNDDDRTFPFSAFAMFSAVWAEKPYAEHKGYTLVLSQFEVPDGRPMPPEWKYWIQYKFMALGFNNDPDTLRRVLEAARRISCVDHGAMFWDLGGMPLIGVWDPAARERRAAAWREARERYDRGELNFQEVPALALKRVVYRIPAYPAPPDPVPEFEGHVAACDAAGGFRAVVADVRAEPDGWWSIGVRSAGYAQPAFRFGYVLNNAGPARPLEADLRADRYFVRRPPSGSCYLLIHVTDPSLAGTRTYFGPAF
jgi:hypothetical protein